MSKNVLDQFRLDGRRALVTGAARGLGKVIAAALAEAGADVVVASRTLAPATAAELTAEKGRLVVSAGWLKRKEIAVSGSVTGVTLSTALARVARNDDRAGELESLSGALTEFTTAQFGRDGTFDDAALDEALQSGVRLLKRLTFEQTWVMKRLRRRPVVVPLEGQATWSR